MAQVQPNTSVVAASDNGATVVTFLPPSSLPVLRFQPAAQPRALKDEVEELIRLWRHSKHKPPFTTGELVVIAHVLSDLKPQRLKEIHYKILSTLAYYNRRALLAFTDQFDAEASASYDSEEKSQLGHILPGLYEAARDFEHPLNCVDEFDPSHDTDVCENKYTMCAKAARIYLRDRLEPLRQGYFDFMGLPAELREKIYKMLLVYPRPGLTLADNAREPIHRNVRLGLWSRTDLEIPAHISDTEVPENEFAVGSLTKTLAVLVVSKQVRQEALPVFYGRNTFNFGSLRSLDRALELLSHETVKDIRDLRIVVNRKRMGDPLPQLKKLRSFEALRKLTLTVPRDSAFWNHICIYDDENRAATPSELSKLKRVTELNEIIALTKRAKHVEFRGDGFLGNYIRQKIGQPAKTQ
ncbi:hypothetical protein CKM354_001020200 [Cercospora kikuchii]|uniref:DUF7730 domain-containing protein n=1 Tax=Cercospora kikuchii TaxID=84275 RepID=A0A9P3FJL1_9PEZI|nr:uncharacterized protein CKM354_001020200 [Cercospora kikuchii]GIZ47102.1 hypothetical protein CKM354_001020200 [Cercospora kikuchii]